MKDRETLSDLSRWLTRGMSIAFGLLGLVYIGTYVVGIASAALILFYHRRQGHPQAAEKM